MRNYIEYSGRKPSFFDDTSCSHIFSKRNKAEEKPWDVSSCPFLIKEALMNLQRVNLSEQGKENDYCPCICFQKHLRK